MLYKKLAIAFQLSKQYVFIVQSELTYGKK